MSLVKPVIYIPIIVLLVCIIESYKKKPVSVKPTILTILVP